MTARAYGFLCLWVGVSSAGFVSRGNAARVVRTRERARVISTAIMSFARTMENDRSRMCARVRYAYATILSMRRIIAYAPTVYGTKRVRHGAGGYSSVAPPTVTSHDGRGTGGSYRFSRAR